MEHIRSTGKVLLEMISKYQISGMYFFLFLLSLAILFFMKKEKENRNFLISTSLIALFVVYNPVLAWILIHYFLGEDVYWRMFWILPMVFTIAYTGSNLCAGCKGWVKKGGVMLVIGALIVWSGKLAYSNEFFSVAENPYKLPQDTIQIVEMIQEDGLEKPRLAVPISLCTTIRQYDGSLHLLYGRSVVIREKKPRRLERIYNQINGLEKFQPKKFAKRLRWRKVNYVVFYKDFEKHEKLTKYGFEVVGTTDSYILYKDARAKD